MIEIILDLLNSSSMVIVQFSDGTTIRARVLSKQPYFWARDANGYFVWGTLEQVSEQIKASLDSLDEAVTDAAAKRLSEISLNGRNAVDVEVIQNEGSFAVIETFVDGDQLVTELSQAADFANLPSSVHLEGP